MTRLLMLEEQYTMRPHLMAWHALLTLLCTVLLCAGVQAGCLDQKGLRGVNLSGAEFGHDRLPGLLNKDYVYPSRKDLAYFRGLKMTVIRVPFRWERLQKQVNAALDPPELAQLRQVVAWATELDLCVLLDLHNFGAYHGRILGSTGLPASAFSDVWLRLSKEFDKPDEVAFGLMNEPAPLPVAQWMAIAQQTVLALRQAGAKNLLLVSSGRWSGAHEWATKFDGASAAIGFRNFRDPLNNFAIEVHQYADANYSGTGSTCIDPARLSTLMASITSWAKQEKKRLFLGEFGVASSSDCLAALKTLLESAQDADAWLGWTYWSAGPWWGSYPFSIQPGNAEAAPQTNVLRAFLPG